MAKKYDAFLSHSSADKDAVEGLARWLEDEAGLTVWLDKWHLVPGDPWQEELERALDDSGCCVVFVGPGGIAGWHNEEVRAALRRRVRREVRVLPVLLPGGHRPGVVPKFLDGLTWVEFRRDISEREARNRLVAGIRGREPGRSGGPDVAQSLESAIDRLTELRLDGGPTEEASKEVLRLKRELRDGHSPSRGDILNDRYQLGEGVGQGSFAAVWRAVDRTTSRVVAVKVLHGQWAGSDERRERFFRGARKMYGLDHPGIVRVLDVERHHHPSYYFVMEYLDGGDFENAVLGGVAAKFVVDVVLRVGAAIQYAHERGVVHRDVKPANILLSRSGEVKLTDFDLVRAADSYGGTRQGLGTFVYAAPEAMDDGRGASPRSDVYSLGMTLLFGLARESLPLSVIRDPEVFLSAMNCTQPMKGVVRRAIEWEPGRRYESAQEFVEALQDPGLLVRVPRAGGIPSDTALWSKRVESEIDRRENRQFGSSELTDTMDIPGGLGGAATEGYGRRRRLLGALVAGISLFALLSWVSGLFLPPSSVDVLPVAGDFHQMVWVSPGTFQIGSPELEPGRDDEEWQYEVTLTRGFYMLETEVTQGLYEAVMGGNPSEFKEGGADRPVENVSWFDAIRFSNRLSEIAGLETCYHLNGVSWEWPNKECGGYRLPTEAEWEYAARAGTNTSTYAGQLEILGVHDGPALDLIAWYGGNSGVGYMWSDGWDSSAWEEKQYEHASAGTRMVGSRAPNEWGLHDMLGNVWEWCWDWYLEEGPRGQLDPAGPVRGEERVMRGGSWRSVAGRVRAAYRSHARNPDTQYNHIGFRVVRGR